MTCYKKITIPIDELDRIVGGYKTNRGVSFLGSRGPEYQALLDLIAKKNNNRDTTVTLPEIYTALTNAAPPKKEGKHYEYCYRPSLLFRPNHCEKDKTGVSDVIRKIGKALLPQFDGCYDDKQRPRIHVTS